MQGLMAPITLLIPLLAGVAFAQVTVVRDGEIRAVVVTAADPSPVAAYAAKELVNHVEKATGKRLPVAVETDIPDGYASRIFVGVTEAALGQGIDPDKLEPEASVLRTVGDDLYIVGKELKQADYQGSRKHGEPWNPLSNECIHSGTQFGVYDVLDRYVGVRWLWPGELGTYVPRTDTIEIPQLDETNQPRLKYRDLSGWSSEQVGLTGSHYGRKIPTNFQHSRLNENILRKLVFPTEEAGYDYGLAMNVYHRRHRRATPIETRPVLLGGHEIAGIDDWWARYGKAHPEWFAMRADGQRGPKAHRPGPWTALCVSNAELHRAIVQAWKGGDILVLGEADAASWSMCHCKDCEAWDGPQEEDYPVALRTLKYEPRAMGDRYARYWKTIYDMAVKRNPNVRISAYLYHNTLPAPLKDIQLNKNIYGEFVIYGSWDGWYPMIEEEDQWYRDQWLGWEKTGISLVYGPNYLLNNYVTPNVTTRQSGEFFRFAYEHGMVGVNYRSYTFSWAAHGPMAYMHHRLLDNPELGIDEIRREFFSAFGPAADEVEKYFDYWEEYARTRPAILDFNKQVEYDTFGRLEKLRRARGHYLAYPPEVYPPAEAMLDKALDAARLDAQSEFAERVEFLRAGLKHALLATRLYGFLDYASPEAGAGSVPTDPARLDQARQAMAELIRFRQNSDHLFVSDYMSNATWEKAYIQNIEALLE